MEQTIVSNNKQHKFIKRPVMHLYYNKKGTQEFNGLPTKEPNHVYYRSKNPIDLTSVKTVIFSKSFKKAKTLTELDLFLIDNMPNLENIDFENVKHIDNFNDIFKPV